MIIEIDMPMAEKTLGPFLQERITYSIRCSLCKFGFGPDYDSALIIRQATLHGFHVHDNKVYCRYCPGGKEL
jgi:hypothetical protein